MKTVVLVETGWSGHVPARHKLFIKALLEIGCYVISFSPSPKEIDQWAAVNVPEAKSRLTAVTFKLRWAVGYLTHYSYERSSPSFIERMLHWGRALNIPYIDALGNGFYAIKTWQAAFQAIHSFTCLEGLTPDLIFFPFVDWDFMATGIQRQMIDKIFPYPWSGLYLNPTAFGLSRGSTKTGVIGSFLPAYNIFRSKNLIALAVLDEGPIEQLRSYTGKPVVFFPDNMDESVSPTNSDIAKRMIEKAAGRKIIGLFGVLSARKGMKTLLQAAELCRHTHEEYFFVFAGPFYAIPPGQETEEIKHLISLAAGNCFFHLEQIEKDEEFNKLMTLSDVVFIAYYKFYHSSGILTKAAVFHKPAIVSEEYCMGERVKKYRLGLTIPEGDVNRCVEAIRCLCEGKDYDGNPLQPDFEGYCALHSQERLVVAFENILQYV